jgi:hypothetical protein
MSAIPSGSRIKGRRPAALVAVAGLVLGLASVSVIALPAHEAGADTDVVTTVTLGGDPAAPTVTVRGSGFGTESDLGTAIPAYCSETGSDYASNFYFSDLSDGWAAGQGSGPVGDCIGVFIVSYSDSQITFGFGNGYGNGAYGAVANGDHFSGRPSPVRLCFRPRPPTSSMAPR